MGFIFSVVSGIFFVFGFILMEIIKKLLDSTNKSEWKYIYIFSGILFLMVSSWVGMLLDYIDKYIVN